MFLPCSSVENRLRGVLSFWVWVSFGVLMLGLEWICELHFDVQD